MVKQELLEMLQDLGQENLKTFQWHLQDHEFLGGFQEIKKIMLEKADTRETVDVMINTYTSKHAVDVAKLILRKMHLNEELTKLSKNMELSRITPCPPQIRKTPSPPPFRKDFLGDQKLRSELMKYSCQLKVNTNTLSSVLKLSDNNRKVTNVEEDQKYPDHTDRFDGWAQLLCRNNPCDRQYWEVEWRGHVILSVSYSSIRRKGDSNASVFGMNDKSWSLECSDTGYTVCHKERATPVSTSSVSNRVAVYVDCPTGTLSFYRVSSDSLIELYTFNTTFTEPLYPGFGVWAGSSVFLC